MVQYDYKILIYGNYTFQKNLEADSLVEVLRRVIPFVSKLRKIHWTILIPEEVKSLQFDNVDQKIYRFPNFPNLMRQHFDTWEFLEHLNWRHTDFDIVYSHLPEHTNQLSNIFHNYTNINAEFIGYSHWFETQHNSERFGFGKGYPISSFMSAMNGILHMKECGVNSKWLKDLVIEEASQYFNQKVLDDLDKKIQPHYLGVDRIDIRKTYSPKSVIFNHRGNDYTGWKWFCDIMDEVWKERQDFKVYTTLVEIDKEWNEHINTESRDEYMNTLKNMKFGVGCFRNYSAWSISTTDGFSVGVPYLVPTELCYEEMINDKDYPYFYENYNKEDFKKRFNEMLDADELYSTTKIAEKMKWDNQLKGWFNNWDIFDNLRQIKETKTTEKLAEFIRTEGKTNKTEIMKFTKWGPLVKFNGYRNSLREYKGIKFTKDGYEWIG
ncbi:hypothetical protein N8748_01120 [bacterium]|nr:hypothetical protein [bacterium]|tara:strand:- start:694 stop:2004 length:1311 start_codon:yes stop_codon:yes gene_type:complete